MNEQKFKVLIHVCSHFNTNLMKTPPLRLLGNYVNLCSAWALNTYNTKRFIYLTEHRVFCNLEINVERFLLIELDDKNILNTTSILVLCSSQDPIAQRIWVSISESPLNILHAIYCELAVSWLTLNYLFLKRL